jgi:pimeloyl-ACP methyl ester carboxylesterase
MTTVHHRYCTVEGQQMFYREAGPPAAPAIVLLHGFPASSFMFRNLIPSLAGQYRVIAPDHLGFGFSDTPPADDFHYTFDALASLTGALLRQLGVTRYAMYVQDYGAPIGWRLALADPAAVTAIVTQNGNGYEAGFTEDFWQPVREYWHQQNPHTEQALRGALTLEAIRWQYLHGVPDESVVSPDTWHHDFDLVSRPGSDAIQLRLSPTTPRTSRCTPTCTPTCVTAACRYWPSGGATTRSSAQTERERSRRTHTGPRSTSSTADIFSSRASSTPRSAASCPSCKGACHDRTPGGPDGAGRRAW